MLGLGLGIVVMGLMASWCSSGGRFAVEEGSVGEGEALRNYCGSCFCPDYGRLTDQNGCVMPDSKVFLGVESFHEGSECSGRFRMLGTLVK